MSIDLFAAYERRAEEKIKGWIREALWQRGIGSRFLDLGHGRGGVPLASLPAHASTHQNAGSDEMSVAGLSGLLADAQTPAAHVLDGAVHTVAGLTAGDVLTALTATTFGFDTPTAPAHNILSATHTDSDAADTPAEGDHLVYLGGLWVADSAGDELSDDDGTLLLDDDTAILVQDVGDASGIVYTPTVLTDWDGDSDPGDVDNALDQLAERVEDLEGAGGGGDVATDPIWDALGDTVYGSGANTGAKLAGNTTTTRKFLRQVGDGGASAAPAWDTIAAGDYPTMVGANGGAGTKGAVPAPSAGDAAAGKFLKADGTWTAPTGSGGASILEVQVFS